MKRLLGSIAQAVIISTLAIVAVLNSSVPRSGEIQNQIPVPSVTVVTAE